MNGLMSPSHLLVIGIVVLVLFGRGKVSGMMGEVGKGISAFKKGMDEGRREIEDAKVTAARDVTPPETIVRETSADAARDRA